MRLARGQIKAIEETVLSFDSNAEIYLFGSRVDDSKHGGDIDLLVMSEKISAEDRRKIRLKLIDEFGAQKIDIVLAKENSKPFVRIAQQEGVKL